MVTARFAHAEPSGTPATDLALSVVLVTPDTYQTIRKTVHHLRAQTAAKRIEVIIAAPDSKNLNIDQSEMSGFGGWRVVEVGPIRTFVAAKIRAINAAAAPVIVEGEDHSFPEPGWAEALIAAHEKGYAVVGPAVRNANPRTLLSWANYLMHFGAWSETVAQSGPVEQIAWHNGSYRADVLRSLGDTLPPLLAVESHLQQELRQQGHEIYLTADAVTNHLNVSRWMPALRASFWGGRLYGASRATRATWPLGKRLVYFFGAPLIPLMRLPRLFTLMERCGLSKKLLPGILGPLLPLLALHAAGEAAGYALGSGKSEEKYSFFEMRRIDLLCSEDRKANLPG